MSRVSLAACATALVFASSVEAEALQDRGAGIDQDAASRLASAARVVKQARVRIPAEDWARARCVIVFPKAGNAADGRTGGGVMSCRSAEGWGAPLFVRLARESRPTHGDLVLLMTHESAVAQILENRVQLGHKDAGIVSFVSSNGQLVAVDLSDSEVAPDEDTDVAVYGRGAVPSTILASRQLSAPTDASPLLGALGAASLDLERTAPSTPASQAAPRGSNAEAGAADRSTNDAELRAQLMNAEQTIDRMLGESTPLPTGTSGVRQEGNDPRDPRRAGTVVVDRARLLQLRQQVEAMLARLKRRS